MNEQNGGKNLSPRAAHVLVDIIFHSVESKQGLSKKFCYPEDFVTRLLTCPTVLESGTPDGHSQENSVCGGSSRLPWAQNNSHTGILIMTLKSQKG